MKKKRIQFRKSSFKKKIYPLLNETPYLNLYSRNSAFISQKQLECSRVTVSRLTRNGVSYWNTNKYRNEIVNLYDDIIDFDLFDKKEKYYNYLKKKMVYFFRNRQLFLKKFKKKDKQKKQKKKQSNVFIKQKKQKDIFFKRVSRKISYRLKTHLNLPLVRRSNKSRMGKGKSKISHYVRLIHFNDKFIRFDRLDRKRRKLIQKQLNYKTNLNLFYLT